MECTMQQNRSLAGAADAIERTKSAGSEVADEMQNAAGNVADRAKRAYEETRETAGEIAGEAYDQVGEAFRSGEDFVRRHPLESLAMAAAVAFVAGWMFRR
jgi:ElaB/YqjD/DUF883 family membrane-anchored ribosome-binding protein